MAVNSDSRPFAVIRQDKTDLLQQVERDVQLLSSEFSKKLSTLLLEPDSAQTSSSRRLTANLEFSKAKLEIFTEMKKLVEVVSNEWGDKIQEMLSTFLENIELLLAKTTLSVILPTPEELSRTDMTFKGRKSRNSPSSSFYPALLNTAKHIPVLNSLLPNDEEEEEESETDRDGSRSPSKQIRRSPKQVTIVTPDEMPAEYIGGGMESSDSDSEEEPPPTPVRRRGSMNTTPLSQPKMPLKSSLRKTAIANSFVDSNNSVGRSSLRSRVLTRNENEDSDNASARTPTQRRGRKGNMKEVITIEDEAVSTPDLTSSRRGRRRKLPEETSQDPNWNGDLETPVKNGNFSTPVSQKTSSNVAEFSVGMNINDDLDVYSPDISLSRSANRRKTALADIPDVLATPVTARSRGKRKTIAASVVEETVAPSPKRLKRGGGRISLLPPAARSPTRRKGRKCNEKEVIKIADEEAEELTDNLLDSDGSDQGDNYSSWVPLSDVGPRIPAQPGIYELKVSAAKKSAYIGGCDSLRQKLTLHKLKGNSGHKHLDKFVERNASNILVRFAQLPSLEEAKNQEKIRVKAFVSQYKTTPAYN